MSVRDEGLTAYRVADVRAAEEVALTTVPQGALMQRAAAAVAATAARELRRRRGGVSGRRVALLVGGGNNGGDALWAGARLADRGARVDAVLTSSGVHGEGLAALLRAGGRVVDMRSDRGPSQAATVLVRADLVVDGIVGLGGTAGLRSVAAGLVHGIPDGVPVIAVDLPSGVDPDTGEVPDGHVRADVTVTFGAAKPCLVLPPACAAAGRVELVDLGFGPHLPIAPAVGRLGAAGAAELWPVPDATSDKYGRGVVGVVAGSASYPGAAVLACAGAVRAGAGMVRYLGPEEATAAVRTAWPEVVAGPGRVQAWVCGPGVDPDADDEQAGAVEHALASGEPCVLDAGAITLWARSRQDGGGPDDVSARVLLTPHAGELARLLTDLGSPADRADVVARPYPAAAEAAARSGATVLLKGSTTLVVRPDGRARSQSDAPPWLATAGAGDVLAGIAGTLLAAGLDPLDAGALAALVHGRAATAASGGGPVAAADVAAAVPAAVAALLARP